MDVMALRLRPAIPLHLQHIPGQRALADGPPDAMVPWLAEMQPGMFVEMSEELAKDKASRTARRYRQDIPRRGGCHGHRHASHEALQHRRQHHPHGGHSLALRLGHHGATAMTTPKDKKPEVFTTGDAANLLTPYDGGSQHHDP